MAAATAGIDYTADVDSSTAVVDAAADNTGMSSAQAALTDIAVPFDTAETVLRKMTKQPQTMEQTRYQKHLTATPPVPWMLSPIRRDLSRFPAQLTAELTHALTGQ